MVKNQKEINQEKWGVEKEMTNVFGEKELSTGGTVELGGKQDQVGREVQKVQKQRRRMEQRCIIP